MPDSDDWLHRYEAEARAAPRLEPSEESALVAAVRAGNDGARETLLRSDRAIVLGLARRAARMQQADLEALVRAGDTGLHTALDRFDGSKGFKFSTYATWWVRQAIVRFTDPGSRPPSWN